MPRGGLAVVLGRERPRLDRLAVYDRVSPERRMGHIKGATRTAVHERRSTVRQDDVGRPASDGTEAAGFASPPPDRFVATGVPVVGPHQELEAFDGELEVGADLPGLPVLQARCAQQARIDGELDDYRLASQPEVVEDVDGWARCPQRLVVDRDPGGCVEAGRGLSPGADDDPPTQGGRIGRHRRHPNSRALRHEKI
ncbi:MAG: hypothetical protein NVS3B21_19980 [Acidimicrobiales bacterium]